MYHAHRLLSKLNTQRMFEKPLSLIYFTLIIRTLSVISSDPTIYNLHAKMDMSDSQLKTNCLMYDVKEVVVFLDLKLFNSDILLVFLQLKCESHFL